MAGIGGAPWHWQIGMLAPWQYGRIANEPSCHWGLPDIPFKITLSHLAFIKLDENDDANLNKNSSHSQSAMQ